MLRRWLLDSDENEREIRRCSLGLSLGSMVPAPIRLDRYSQFSERKDLDGV